MEARDILRHSNRLRRLDSLWTESLGQVAQGDRKAFEDLYADSVKQVYGLLMTILEEEAIAEEVLLDVYTQIWRRASNLESEFNSAKVWLSTLTRELAIERRRSIQSAATRSDTGQEDAGGETDFSGPESVPSGPATARDACPLFQILSPEQKEVIELSYFGGLAPREIARRLGESTETVSSRLQQAMIALREALERVHRKES